MRRLEELAPFRQPYTDLERALWPYLTVGMRPNLAEPFLTTDSRGYRLSRHGDATVASDDAPAEAAFVLGGSYVYGHGASDDSGTILSAL